MRVRRPRELAVVLARVRRIRAARRAACIRVVAVLGPRVYAARRRVRGVAAAHVVHPPPERLLLEPALLGRRRGLLAPARDVPEAGEEREEADWERRGW